MFLKLYYSFHSSINNFLLMLDYLFIINAATIILQTFADDIAL